MSYSSLTIICIEVFLRSVFYDCYLFALLFELKKFKILRMNFQIIKVLLHLKFN